MRFEAGRLSATAAASIACVTAWTRICAQVILRASAHQCVSFGHRMRARRLLLLTLELRAERSGFGIPGPACV